MNCEFVPQILRSWDERALLGQSQAQKMLGFPGGTVAKNQVSAGDRRSVPVREDPTCPGAPKPVLWSLGTVAPQ